MMGASWGMSDTPMTPPMMGASDAPHDGRVQPVCNKIKFFDEIPVLEKLGHAHDGDIMGGIRCPPMMHPHDGRVQPVYFMLKLYALIGKII